MVRRNSGGACIALNTVLRKKQVEQELVRIRNKTISLLRHVPMASWNMRVHDFYSPIGWHFGHIGMTEELWTATRALGRAPLQEPLCFLFANIPENPKDQRVHLPSKNEVVEYLEATRRETVAALHDADLAANDPLLADGYAWEFAIQHECQHQETICELLQLICQQSAAATDIAKDALTGRYSAARTSAGIASTRGGHAENAQMVAIGGGTVALGSNQLHDYDNEKQAHEVRVEPFFLDVDPVTVSDWLQFVCGGGYEKAEYWTEAGAGWLAQSGARCPEYWVAHGDFDFYCSPTGVRSMNPMEPVTSISWYEADAYARWAGKRLPTEAEWEFAAAYDPTTKSMQRYPWGDDIRQAKNADCDLRTWGPATVAARRAPNALGLRGMAGGVWEWTSTPFLPYPGFEPFPYDGYSKEHMDGNHYVCRGGSWATDPRILRTSFRNWYVPSYRQGILGMRCAR